MIKAHIAGFLVAVAPFTGTMQHDSNLTKAEAGQEVLVMGRHACETARHGNEVAGFDPLAELQGTWRADRISVVTVDEAAHRLCPRLLVQVNVGEIPLYQVTYLRKHGWYGEPDDGGEYLYDPYFVKG